MRTPTSPLFTVSSTPNKAIVIRCALVTPVRSTVTVVVPLPLLVATEPVPSFTAAPLKVTGAAKVTITL